jgi:hypothetical protein
MRRWRSRCGDRRIALPPMRSGVLRVIIETSTGFVPARLDPTSQDQRSLGAWITMAAQNE